MIAAMIKSAIVLAIAGCIASLMKRQSAAVRHAVWTAGLMGAMAIPLCTLTLPSWQARFAGPVVVLFQSAMGELGVLRQAAIGLWIAGAATGFLPFVQRCEVCVGGHRRRTRQDTRWGALAEEVRRSLGIR
jgi:hypothetical protein